MLEIPLLFCEISLTTRQYKSSYLVQKWYIYLHQGLTTSMDLGRRISCKKIKIKRNHTLVMKYCRKIRKRWEKIVVDQMVVPVFFCQALTQRGQKCVILIEKSLGAQEVTFLIWFYRNTKETCKINKWNFVIKHRWFWCAFLSFF